MTFKIEMPVDPQRIADLLTSAFEGGSSYWLGQVRPRFKGHAAYSEADAYGEDMIEREITDDEDDNTGQFNRENIQRGLNLLGTIAGGRHLADFLSENDDAETGDVFLQLVVFGEVIFG